MGHVRSRCGLCCVVEPLGLVHLPLLPRRPRGPVTVNGDRRHELAVRLWSRVAGPWCSTPEHPIGPDDCWLWLGALNEEGLYGRLRRGRRGHGLVGPHRVALELMDEVSYLPGTAPDRSQLVACHRCDTPLCCHPGHLFWGTRQENARDMVRKRRHRWSRRRPSAGRRAYARYLGERALPVELGEAS
jgi:hypothetical protein